MSDPSLYFKRSRSGRLMMIYRFVDDMQGSYHADDAAEFQECSLTQIRLSWNGAGLPRFPELLGFRLRQRVTCSDPSGRVTRWHTLRRARLCASERAQHCGLPMVRLR